MVEILTFSADVDAKQKVMHLLQEHDSTYDNIKHALMGCTAISFASTAEAVFTADWGKLHQLPLRQAVDKMFKWVTKLMQESETVTEAASAVTVAAVRSMMIPEVKTYIDMSKEVEKHQLVITGE